MPGESLMKRYPQIFRRISLDEIDIVAKGEKPKHRLYILLEDVLAIINVIKTEDEAEAVKFIASKIRRTDKGN